MGRRMRVKSFTQHTLIPEISCSVKRITKQFSMYKKEDSSSRILNLGRPVSFQIFQPDALRCTRDDEVRETDKMYKVVRICINLYINKTNVFKYITFIFSILSIFVSSC